VITGEHLVQKNGANEGCFSLAEAAGFDLAARHIAQFSRIRRIRFRSSEG
jgi:hypothetical protein